MAGICIVFMFTVSCVYFLSVTPEVQTSTDWATMTEEDDWAEKHQKVKLNKQVKVEDVVVASCSDDGTIRVWRPLQVSDSVW